MRAWLASWRLAARIARRDARRHKGRTALVVAMLLLPALAGSAGAVFASSAQPTPQTRVDHVLGDDAQARIRWNLPACPLRQTADGEEVACAPGTDPELTGLSPTELSRLLGSTDTLVAGTWQRTNLVHGDRAVPLAGTLQIEAAPLGTLLTASAGRLPERSGEVLLAAGAAQDLAITPGQALTLRTEQGKDVTATVTGIGALRDGSAAIVAAPGTLPEDEGMVLDHIGYVPAGSAVTWPAVQRLNEAGYAAFSRAVVLDPPPDAPKPGSLVPGASGDVFDWVTIGFGAIALIEVVLIVGPAFAVGAKRARRTLALVTATGGTPRDLSRIVRAGGLLQGLAAGLLGAGIGTTVSAVIVQRNVGSTALPNLVLPWPTLAVMVAATALLGMAAAWLPGRSVARLDAAAALRESPEAARRKAGVPWLGLGVVGLGVVISVVASGSASGDAMASMAGIVTILLGIVLLAGPIVRLVARLAPRTGIASRLALRDADRHRSRTAPALAAVIACVASGTFMVGFASSAESAQNSVVHSALADGLISVADTGDTGEKSLDGMVRRVESVAPLAHIEKVRVVDAGPRRMAWIQPLCAGFDPGDDFPFAGAGPCVPEVTGYTSLTGQWGARDYIGGQPTIVDDGAAVARTELPEAEQAGAALRAGLVLVNDRGLIDGSGQVTLRAQVHDKGSADDAAPISDETVRVDARYVPWRADLYRLVIPPQVAEQLKLGTWLSGYLLVPAEPLTGTQQAQLNGMAATVGSAGGAGVDVRIAAEPGPPSPFLLLALAAIAALVAAAATWVAVGLAKADTRADMATLAAVGASPGTRRRFAGAQAGVIALVGAAIGTATGIGMLVALIALMSAQASGGETWGLEIPWPAQLALAVGVPLIAIAGAMLATRSRLPALTRRLT